MTGRFSTLLTMALVLAMAGPVMSQTVQTTPASTQVSPVSLEAAAAAVDSGDLTALQSISTDAALLDLLRQTDPEALIEVQMALADAYAVAGLRTEAVQAYQQALTSILAFRGQGDISMAEPMTAIARLATDPAVKAQWFLSAYDVREAVWGRGNTNLAPYRVELNAARVAAGLAALGTRGAPQDGSANFDLVDIYYATHRAPTGQVTPTDFYGGERGDTLRFGVAEVSVPHDRERGEVPRPSIWTLEFRPDPDRHMILNSITPVSDRDAFFRRVSEVVSHTERKEVFVFMHGYNTSFEGAAIRTAQLAVDMNLDGAPILYSWPSRASLLGYAADTRTVADQALLTDVADFLTQVAERTGATRVHLVAHSMGNRVLMRALDVIATRRPGQPPMFNEVVLAAADVGVDEFETTWPRIVPTGGRFTLYASQRDRALQISQQVNDMRRVGDARVITVRDGLQTIDTTAASGGGLGHDDFAGSALADFRAVMWLSLAPDRRCVLETEQAAGQRYWAFGAGGCPTDAFDEATQLVRSNGTIENALAKLDDDMSKAAQASRSSLQQKRERVSSMFNLMGLATQAMAPVLGTSPAGAP